MSITTRRPIRLVKAASPDLDEVEIWRRLDSLPLAKRSEVMDRIKLCDDPLVRDKALKLLRACYVV